MLGIHKKGLRLLPNRRSEAAAHLKAAVRAVVAMAVAVARARAAEATVVVATVAMVFVGVAMEAEAERASPPVQSRVGSWVPF